MVPTLRRLRWSINLEFKANINYTVGALFLKSKTKDKNVFFEILRYSHTKLTKLAWTCNHPSSAS